MRQGLLSSYAVPPSRPNVPPRTQTTNFPAPPRPPPPSASKPSFSPPRTSSQRYARFSRADTGWDSAGADDAKAKTNDFRAWEQMRHGQGPIPPRRAPPPKSPRTATFGTDRTSPPVRSSHGGTANGVPRPARGAWEDLRDAGMPNLSRANTTRPSPKKASFMSASPDANETPTRSAYFNVFKGERPPSSKVSTNMPPPPPPRAPTSKKPDPLPSYVRESLGSMHGRVSTPYHAQGGEKTAFASPEFQRSSTSATPRDSNSRSGWYEKDSSSLHSEHKRAASASAVHRDDDQNVPGVSSSTTTESSSSSDEAEAQKLYTRHLGAKIPKSAKARMPAGAGIRPRPGFSPHVRIENAEDEAAAPHTFLNTGFRRHSGIDLPTQTPFNDQPEGFMEHRKNHEASQPDAESASAPAARGAGPGVTFMQRHRSFDEKYRSPSGNKKSPGMGNDQKDQAPMYAKPGYNPSFSPLLSGPPSMETQPSRSSFKSTEKPTPCVAEGPPCWPYWAIPSSLPPIAETEAQKQLQPNIPIFFRLPNVRRSHADNVFASFRWTTDDSTGPFVATPPLRSQSSESINMKFSPSGNPPKFGGHVSFFPPPSSDRSEGRSSFPVEANPSQQGPLFSEPAQDEAATTGPGIPPPPKGPSKYSSQDWDKRFGAHTFEPPPSGSSSRAGSRKRSGTPKTGSLNNLKRAGTFGRPTAFQPNVVDAEQEPSIPTTTTTESLNSSTTSSRVSTGSDGSAMDIDSTPPPSTDANPKVNGEAMSSTRTADRPDTPRGPTLPPRAKMPLQSEADSPNMNLGGFKNVAPFAPSNEGLDGIEDLKTALPFESRASSNKPIFENCTKKIDLPKLPKTPSPPLNLTQTSWNRYLADMNSYVFQWNTFSAQMLLLFQRRQEEHREIGPAWVGQVGGDCDAYLQALDEDERARKYWEVGCERHRECFRSLKKVREDLLRSQVSR